MDGIFICSNCNIDLADLFCICSGLPPLCSNCREIHKAKPEFHFVLPIAGKSFVTPQNQRDYKVWLLCLADSQAKLRENMQLLDQCIGDIQTLYRHIQTELNKLKEQHLQTLEALKTALNAQMEEAIKETSANAYSSNYQASSELGTLVWGHSCMRGSDPISVFTYQIQPNVESLANSLGVSFQTRVAGLQHLNCFSRDLTQEINRLKDQVRTLDLANDEKAAELAKLRSPWEIAHRRADEGIDEIGRSITGPGNGRPPWQRLIPEWPNMPVNSGSGPEVLIQAPHMQRIMWHSNTQPARKPPFP